MLWQKQSRKLLRFLANSALCTLSFVLSSQFSVAIAFKDESTKYKDHLVPMSELSDLYQEVILDHNKKPRNFRKLENANRSAQGFNPLCGDQLDVYLQIEDDQVKDVSFEGSGCAISKASASMMTQAVKGKTKVEVETLFNEFHRMAMGELDEENEPNNLGKLKIFSGVRDYPARVKCATLSWHTMHAALEGENSATTE